MYKLAVAGIVFIVLLVIIVIIGRIRLGIRFRGEVSQLFAQSKPIVNRQVSFSQLDTVPPPVQRYFKHVLKDGQPYISYARITHDGVFKTGKDKGWANITGEQYATTQKPGFIWKGTTTLFTARDMFIADRGRLVVSLLSLFNIVDAKGGSYNEGELLRWLGESVLYPTNLLPSERLQWSAIDDHTARMTFEYDQLSLWFTITFNEVGEITQMETLRHMDEKNQEKWVIKIAGYKEMNNVVVPTTFDVLWRLKTGDFSYAQFNITRVEYDKPVMF